MTKQEKEKRIIDRLEYFGRVEKKGGYVKTHIVLDIISKVLVGKSFDIYKHDEPLTDEERKAVDKVFFSMLEKGILVRSKRGTCVKLVKEAYYE